MLQNLQKIFFTLLFIGICSSSFCQSYKTDTLKNAIASVNSFSLLGINGLTSSKDVYVLGYNLDNNNGNPMSVEMVRIDLERRIDCQQAAMRPILAAYGDG